MRWVNPGTPILTVDDLSTIWTCIDLEETQLGFIQIGSPAQVTLPTKPPIIIRGQVMAIGQEGQFATCAAGVRIFVRFTSGSGCYRPAALPTGDDG